MDILYSMESLLIPIWIATTIFYGVYLMFMAGKFVKWLFFTLLSLMESILTVLIWGIPGVIGVVCLIFPVWLYMALQVSKFFKN